MPDDKSEQAAASDTSRNPSGNPKTVGEPSSFGSSLVTILSTLNVATLLSLFVGLCYFYDRAYRFAYLGPFGLDPNAVPITVQDAIVDGFLGINQHVLWLVVILTMVVVTYVSAIWLGGRYLERLAIRLGLPSHRRPPSPMLAELGRNGGFRTSLLASATALALTVASGAALILIGFPADAAGKRDAEALRNQVKSDEVSCISYGLRSGKRIVGLRIGSSAERQYVMGNDDALHVIKFDDIEEVRQTPVRCGRIPTPERK